MGSGFLGTGNPLGFLAPVVPKPGFRVPGNGNPNLTPLVLDPNRTLPTRALRLQHFLDPEPHLDYTLNIFKKYFFMFASGNRSGNTNFFFSADLYRY